MTEARTTPAGGAGGVRLLHLSDVHFGRPHVPVHVAAAEALAAAGDFDAIVVSGDLSQRARAREFRQARALLDRLRAHAPLLVVPGNHDAAWWFAPGGVGVPSWIHRGYRRHISEELEPTLAVPGALIVGLCSAPGIRVHTLTRRPRDLSVKGALTPAQIASLRTRLAAAPPGALRVVVLHHNVIPGELSQRWGLTRHERMLDALAAAGADLVLAGHDHQERVATIARPAGTFVAATAGTLSNRSRGARPSGLMVVASDAERLIVTPHLYEAASGTFVPQVPHTVSRGTLDPGASPADG